MKLATKEFEYIQIKGRLYNLVFYYYIIAISLTYKDNIIITGLLTVKRDNVFIKNANLSIVKSIRYLDDNLKNKNKKDQNKTKQTKKWD